MAVGAPERGRCGHAAPAEAAGADDEGARLVALNLALGGTARDDAARELDEQYPGLQDRDAILDEAYAAAAGK